MKKFENKVAFVTGGASGIGQLTSIEFAKKGAKVLVADITDGNDTVEMIKAIGGEAVFVKTDVTKADQVKNAVDTAIELWGSLDFAFNNAGIEKTGKLPHEVEEKDFDKEIAVNLKGVWLCIKYEAIQMLKQGKGAIVNTSSGAGLTGGMPDTAYVASKHGVVGLTRQTALAYGKMGIRVNAVCPGAIRTPMLEEVLKDPETRQITEFSLTMGKPGEVIDIANAVLWLCSDESAFVNGVPLPVDGGWVAM